MSDELAFGERRLYERKDCLFSIELDDFKKPFSGRLRNLGLGGAFIEVAVDAGPVVGQELILHIPFQRKPSFVIVKGEVAWIKPDGFGVRFLKRKLS